MDVFLIYSDQVDCMLQVKAFLGEVNERGLSSWSFTVNSVGNTYKGFG